MYIHFWAGDCVFLLPKQEYRNNCRPALQFAQVAPEFLWKRSKGQGNCQWCWWDYEERSGHWGGKQNQIFCWERQQHSRGVVSRSRHGLLGTWDTQNWLGSLFCQVSAGCCVSGVRGGNLLMEQLEVWRGESEQKLLGSCGDHTVVTGSVIKVVWGWNRGLPSVGRFLWQPSLQSFQNASCESSFPWWNQKNSILQLSVSWWPSKVQFMAGVLHAGSLHFKIFLNFFLLFFFFLITLFVFDSQRYLWQSWRSQCSVRSWQYVKNTKSKMLVCDEIMISGLQGRYLFMIRI